MSARLQARHAGHRDHGGIVGAKLDARVEDLNTLPRDRFRHAFPQAAVGAHAAGHHQRAVSGLLQCTQRLGNQRLDDGQLHTCGDVGTRGCIERAGRDALLHGQRNGGFQS